MRISTIVAVLALSACKPSYETVMWECEYESLKITGAAHIGLVKESPQRARYEALFAACIRAKGHKPA